MILQGVAGLAAAGATSLVILIAWKVVDGARPSISKFGLAFVWHDVWNPVVGREAYGAASFLFGTVITSFFALLLATPLALGIALFLTELAPRVIRGPVTALVETLAAVPSVVIGLWGILVLGPALRSNIEHWLHSGLGFIPLFGRQSAAGASIFTAIVVLAIMILPIVSSISRELFLGVPPELKEGALALGTTRWEMVRGVVLSSTRPGITATMILGLSRALGEAIAVTQVIGGGSASIISGNFFNNGDTIASRIAGDFLGATSTNETASLFYLAVILLVFGLAANLAAQLIVRRYDLTHRTH
ncbi:MAG TPA: phosphate ABC transporter permease subunit PstC [Gaiellaceae bacterium]|nr:phosphate ABC transporter permease subunit PstC [Gaiellaceae bacterium]